MLKVTWRVLGATRPFPLTVRGDRHLPVLVVVVSGGWIVGDLGVISVLSSISCHEQAFHCHSQKGNWTFKNQRVLKIISKSNVY